MIQTLKKKKQIKNKFRQLNWLIEKHPKLELHN